MTFSPSSLLYLACLALLAGGSRLSDGGLDFSLFRSFHLVDVLAPAALYVTIKNFAHVRAVVPSVPMRLGQAWLVYAFSLAHFGHLFTDEQDVWTPVSLSILFAIKELEFLVFFTLAAYVATKYPRRVITSLTVITAAAATWLLMELMAPTGYYFVGLPLEKGAAQTGTVFGFLAFFLLLVAQNVRWLGLTRRLLQLGAVIMMTGLLLSLSRTALLGFAAACCYFLLARPRAILTFAITVCGFYVIGYWWYSAEIHAFFELVFGRWSDAIEHSADRINKWELLLAYMLDNPTLLVFGAGFNSPNALVLGRELGNILAVDSAYVRRLFEVGVVGSALYYALVCSIFVAFFRSRLSRTGGVLVVFFVVTGITVEAPQVTQLAGLFYLISGSLIGLYSRHGIWYRQMSAPEARDFRAKGRSIPVGI